MAQFTKTVPASQQLSLLAVSDVHGAYGVVEELVAREGKPDVLLIAGDLTTRGSRAEAERALARLEVLAGRLLVVAGNMDPPELEQLFEEKKVSINAHGIVINGVGFFGVSGSPPSPLHTPYEIPEEEIMRRAEKGRGELTGETTRVFVPHAPPAGTRLDRLWVGKHVGSTAVRNVVDTTPPDLLICGHIHEARGLEQSGTCTMVNCGPAADGNFVRARWDGVWKVALLP
jgi:uncharacterized protein